MSVDPFASLPTKERTPGSTRILNQWVQHASTALGTGADRTGWILASTIVVAALQRALKADGEPLFLLKGGVYLERRLSSKTRATKDIDTLFRGSLEEFVDVLDTTLSEPWGPISLSRTELEVIDAPRLIQPQRFNVLLTIRNITWRRIQVEVAFGEGRISEQVERIPSPATSFFGIASPPELVGITLNYQIAQKLHACTDPHQPPEFSNDRVRDIVDLYLVQNAFYPQGTDLSGIRTACMDIFESRATEARKIGRLGREWPPLITTNPLWQKTYQTPATQADVTIDLETAITHLNTWIQLIEAA